MILISCHGMSSWVNGCNVCIPGEVANIVTAIFTAIRYVVPLLLIITGMATLLTATTKQKEEDIKKAQKLLVKKAVAAVIVFLLLTLTKLLINVISVDNDKESIVNCFDALLNYNATTHKCTSDTPGCSVSDADIGNFLEYNDSCKKTGTTGAVYNQFIETNADRIATTIPTPGNFDCFTSDEADCKCESDPQDIPYKKGSDCKCAHIVIIEDAEKNRTHILAETPGLPRTQ